jgi:hypothetical protein
MSQEQLDARGEAHEALGTAVSSYGPRVLGDPQMLGNLVADLLPDLPRERSLLVAGAEAGIATEMTQHVRDQHIDPDTAVQLAARGLAERRAIDPAASMWVAAEYAQALGYQVRPQAQAFQPEQPQVIPGAPPTMTVLPGQPMQTQPPPAMPVSPQVPPMPYAGSAPPQGSSPYYSPMPGQGSWPPSVQSWPQAPGLPDGTPAQGGGGKRRILAAAAAAGVVVLYLVVAAVAHTVPFGKSTPPHRPAAAPSHHKPVQKPRPKPAGPTLAAGIAPLVQLLPADVNPANCKAAPKPGWAAPGLVKAMECYDSGVGTGNSIYAYQMNSLANYKSSWANFNTWASFDSATPSDCPPSGNAQGFEPWNDSGSGGNGFYPTAAGQTLECGYFFANSKNQNEPTYAWSFPSEDAYVIAIGDAGSTFAHLQSWWVNNADPNAAPSPAAS